MVADFSGGKYMSGELRSACLNTKLKMANRKIYTRKTIAKNQRQIRMN